jgi:hypothetical protein
MNFDFPSYSLDFADPDSEEAKETEFRRDVSFLGLQKPGTRCMLKKCQTSVAMAGDGRSSYTVYGLVSGVDRYPLEPPVTPDEKQPNADDAEDGEDEDEDDDRGSEDGEGEADEEIYAGDHIAADLIDEKLDPVIDPRMYFLTRLKTRFDICREFWAKLADQLQMAYRQHVRAP